MATGGLYGYSPIGALVAAPGAESSGLYGNGTNFGGTYFEWFIFKESATQPATPTGGSWDFVTNIGTAPTGWAVAPPSNPTNYVWISIAIVNSRDPNAYTWSTPGRWYVTGLPVLSGTGAPTGGVDNQYYIQTDLTPQAIWFKESGTWVKLTGSSIYADLTSNQTIAGVKTFSSTIQGSISGNAANVTGVVAVANGGTGATTAASALTNLGAYPASNPNGYTNNTGTVTSVAATAGTGISVTGSPITTSGTLNIVNTAPDQTVAISSGTGISVTGTYPNFTVTNTSTSSGGTVTSVNVSGGTTGLTTSGGPVTTSGTITLAGTLAVANGGTGVTTSSGANSVVLRNANQNIVANAFDDGYTNVAASGTQITLTASSPRRYTITGSGGQVIKLPDATTLTSGNIFEFDNNQSSGAITVNNNSNTLIVSIPSGGIVRVNLLSNATAAGSWDRHDFTPANVSWSTNTFDYPGSITSATWNGVAIAVNRGGTGATTAAGALTNLGAYPASNPSGYGTGTVTSVSGTGTVSGLSLSGTVTTSGSLTLGGTLDLSSPPAIGGTTASTGRFTTVTSTIATGTAPFTVASTTPVANLSIGGNAGTVTNGVYTTDTGTVTNTMLAGSITNAKLVNSSITFGSTAQALGSTVTALSGVSIDNGIIGGTTAAAGTFTTLSATSLDNTIIGGTTPAAGTFTTLTANTSVTTPIVRTSGASQSFTNITGEALRITDGASATAGYLNISNEIASATRTYANGAATNVGITWVSKGTGAHNFSSAGAAGTLQMSVSHTASAVNYVQVTGAATGSRPQISAQGSDGNVGLSLYSKGNRSVTLYTNNVQVLDALSPTSSVNSWSVAGSITGIAPTFAVGGSDGNISAVFQSKGTGAIDLAAGSSGVNISNGGTVTAITRTNNGTGYTSKPTMTISAPTTAGGVQAVADFGMFISTVSIVGGGTGYTAGDVLTVSGGTFTTQAQLTVSTVSSGVITAVTVSNAGVYSILTTNPISVTGGTGSGATFNVTAWGLSSGGFVISNSGSGYVEQPTITFSGGGGSAAAAYATVGSIPTLKTLGSALSVFTPSGEAFRVSDIGVASSTWIETQGGSSTARLFAGAAAGSVELRLSSRGTSANNFYTNAFAQQQFSIAHTASAVNYVQVTGAATGGTPTISAQGSDLAIPLNFQTKGAGIFRFRNGSNQTAFTAYALSGAANFVGIQSSVAGVAPILGAEGTDTDIQLSLVPKGLGIVLMTQQTPTAVTATGTLTIANLLTQIITSTSATAVSLTLPTGTLSDAGISGGTSAVNTSFDYSIINTGSAVGDVTLVAGTGHTIVGSAVVTVGTSGGFRCRKTATNTFVSYRV